MKPAAPIRLRYRASLDLWFRDLRGWVGPFASAGGALGLALDEPFSDAQRAAFRSRP